MVHITKKSFLELNQFTINLKLRRGGGGAGAVVMFFHPLPNPDFKPFDLSSFLLYILFYTSF